MCSINNSKQEIIERIKKASHITFIGHRHPDADCIGSCLAFHYIVKQNFNVDSIVINTDKMPKSLATMPGIGDVIFNAQINTLEKKDVLIVLDAGDIDRIGEISKIVHEFNEVIFIDHHKSHDLKNTTMAYVDVKAAATAEIVADICDEYLSNIDSKTATALYCGLVSDTGGFIYINTTDKTLSIAAKILKRNVDMLALGRVIIKRYNEESVKALIYVYNNIIVGDDRRIGYIIIDEGISSANISVSECVMKIETVFIGFIIRETEKSFRVSLRSRCDKDVVVIAESFGGGGHAKAAGFEVSKNNHNKESLAKEIYNKILKLLND